MKISIVIPVYNVEKTIELCLRGLLNQEVLPDEIILIDNGSTDKTVNVIENTIKNITFPKFILDLETKKGPAAARNKGIDIATTDIIAFIDADCIPSKDWIANILKTFEEDNSLDILGGIDSNFILLDTPLIEKFLSAFWITNQNMVYKIRLNNKEDFLKENFVTTFNAIFRKKILLEVKGFDESFYPAGEDTDIWMRALEKGAKIIAWDPNIIVCHHQNIAIKTMIQKAFDWGTALAHLTKKHFHKKIILQLPLLGLKEFENKLYTILICSNIFKLLTLITIMIGISFFSQLIALLILIIFLIYLGIRARYLIRIKNIKISFIENILITFLFIIRELAEEAGRIYGSLRHRVICL